MQCCWNVCLAYAFGWHHPPLPLLCPIPAEKFAPPKIAGVDDLTGEPLVKRKVSTAWHSVLGMA